MMHQESGGWTETRTPGMAAPAGAVSAIAYRSRVASPLTNDELDKILRAAQERNRLEGLSGLLIHDQGYFYQWLEGPHAGLMRVWDSIQRDPRHGEFKVLRQEIVPRRFFKGWDMRLARRTRGDIESVLAVMEVPNDLLSRLRIQPSALAGSAWDEVFGCAVIPHLQATRGCSVEIPGPVAGSKHIGNGATAGVAWHADREADAILAGTLLEVDPAATARYVDGLIDQGAGLEPLYHEVFEPAARYLGSLWEDDRCNDFGVSLAMGRLQMEVHRLSMNVPAMYIAQPGHTILVASQPGEVHGLSAALCATLFARDGWDVSHEIASTDKSLRDTLHKHWFDVLELSLSDAMTREHQLPAMRLTIRAARAASLNPALAVIVDGRSFFERPRAYLDVGADLGCSTSIEAVPAAQHLVDEIADRIKFVG